MIGAGREAQKSGPGTPMPPYWLQHEPGPQIQAAALNLLPVGALLRAPTGHRIIGQCLACYPIQPSTGIIA
jgi:hypothetical protein